MSYEPRTIDGVTCSAAPDADVGGDSQLVFNKTGRLAISVGEQSDWPYSAYPGPETQATVASWRRAADGTLELLSCYGNVGRGCETEPEGAPWGNSRIKHPFGAVITSDDRDVYVATYEILHFKLDADGRLTYVGCYMAYEPFPNSECIPIRNGGGCPNSCELRLSPEERTLYVNGRPIRRETDGTLSGLSCNGQPGCAWRRPYCDNDGCYDNSAVHYRAVMSSDGRWMYTSNGSSYQGWINRYRVFPDGRLLFVDCLGNAIGCRPLPGSVIGLTDARSMAIAPNGRDMYVGSRIDRSTGVPGWTSITHLRIAADGSLSYADCVGEVGTGCTPMPREWELGRPEDITVDPAGDRLYVASSWGLRPTYAIAADGSLSPESCVGEFIVGCTWRVPGSGPYVPAPGSHDLYSGPYLWFSWDAPAWTRTGTPPTVRDEGVYDRTSTGVRLTAYVDAGNGSDKSAAMVEYGRTTAYGRFLQVWSDSRGPGHPYERPPPWFYDAALSGLRCDTTYHYRWVVANEFGTRAGSDHTVSTYRSGCESWPPEASRPYPQSADATRISLWAELFAGQRPTSFHFEYGKTTAYGERTPESTALTVGESDGLGGSVRQVLTGLAPDTRYHVRFVAKSDKGTSYSEDMPFRTWPTAAPPVAPDVRNGCATSVTSNSAMIRGWVNPNGTETSYWFEWGPSEHPDWAYPSDAPDRLTPAGQAGSGGNLKAIEKTLTGLAPNTTYHASFVTTSTAGTYFTPYFSFTTGPDAPLNCGWPGQPGESTLPSTPPSTPPPSPPPGDAGDGGGDAPPSTPGDRTPAESSGGGTADGANTPTAQSGGPGTAQPDAPVNQAESSNDTPQRFTGSILVGRRLTLVGSRLVIRVLCPADAVGRCSTAVRAATATGRLVARRRVDLKPGRVRSVRLRTPSPLRQRRLTVELATRDAAKRRARHRWAVTVVRSNLIVLHKR